MWLLLAELNKEEKYYIRRHILITRSELNAPSQGKNCLDNVQDTEMFQDKVGILDNGIVRKTITFSEYCNLFLIIIDIVPQVCL